MSDWKTDPAALAEQYADSDNLGSRISLHEAYTTSDTDLPVWVFGRMAFPENARVLTLGCGTGDLWCAVGADLPADCRLTVTDASGGMVREARSNLRGLNADLAFAEADAAALPFESGAFDAVTANHMLYHVSERERAIREIARVLAPDGRLYATTNGEGHMAELLDVMSAVADEPVTMGSAFTLDNGAEQLRAAFGNVERHDYDDALRVTDPEDLLAYALSRPELSEADAKAFLARAKADAEDGVFHVSKNVGLFVAGKPEPASD